MICGDKNGTYGCHLSVFSVDVTFARHFMVICPFPTLLFYRSASGIISYVSKRTIYNGGNAASYLLNSLQIDRLWKAIELWKISCRRLFSFPQIFKISDSNLLLYMEARHFQIHSYIVPSSSIGLLTPFLYMHKSACVKMWWLHSCWVWVYIGIVSRICSHGCWLRQLSDWGNWVTGLFSGFWNPKHLSCGTMVVFINRTKWGQPSYCI